MGTPLPPDATEDEKFEWRRTHIGRRTGKCIFPPGKTIRRDSHGFEIFADYYTDEEDESIDLSATSDEIVDGVTIYENDASASESPDSPSFSKFSPRKLSQVTTVTSEETPVKTSNKNIKRSQRKDNAENIHAVNALPLANDRKVTADGPNLPSSSKSTMKKHSLQFPIKSSDSSSNLKHHLKDNILKEANNSSILSELDFSGITTPKKGLAPVAHMKPPEVPINKTPIRSNCAVELSDSDSDVTFSFSSNLNTNNVPPKSKKPETEGISEVGNQKAQKKQTVKPNKNSVQQKKAKTANNNKPMVKSSTTVKKKPIYAETHNNEEDLPVRKSKRTRLPPLEHWRQERAIYKRTSSGEQIVGVQSPMCKASSPMKRPKKEKRLNGVKSRKLDIHEVAPPLTNTQQKNLFNSNTYSGTVVYNPRTGTEEIKTCIGDINPVSYGPGGKEEAKAEDPFSILEFFRNDLFITGSMEVKALAEKPRSFNREHPMIFRVMKGLLKVTIHETEYLLNKGHSFFVPQGNHYELKNVSAKSAAVLLFTCIPATDMAESDSD